MSVPGITNVRAYDWPTLAMQARSDAELAEERRAAAAEFRTVYVGDNDSIRRGLRQNEAIHGAIRNDHYRIAHLIELHGRHPILADVIDALEQGRRVSIEPPPRTQRVSGPPGPTRSRLLNRVLVLLGKLRPPSEESLVLARRPAADLPLFAAE